MPDTMQQFTQYPEQFQHDLFGIYEDQTNPLRPDHSLLEVVIQSLNEDDSALMYVIGEAENDQRLVGAAVVAGENERFLKFCCVLPEQRRHGVGQTLVKNIIAKETNNGHSQLLTAIDLEDRPAHDFLVKLGFQETAQTDSERHLAINL